MHFPIIGGRKFYLVPQVCSADTLTFEYVEENVETPYILVQGDLTFWCSPSQRSLELHFASYAEIPDDVFKDVVSEGDDVLVSGVLQHKLRWAFPVLKKQDGEDLTTTHGSEGKRFVLI